MAYKASEYTIIRVKDFLYPLTKKQFVRLLDLIDRSQDLVLELHKTTGELEVKEKTPEEMRQGVLMKYIIWGGYNHQAFFTEYDKERYEEFKKEYIYGYNFGGNNAKR